MKTGVNAKTAQQIPPVKANVARRGFLEGTSLLVVGGRWMPAAIPG